MATNKARRGGRKNRKHGRQKRKPAAMRYTAQKRDERNKARRAKRRAKQMPKPQKIAGGGEVLHTPEVAAPCCDVPTVEPPQEVR